MTYQRKQLPKYCRHKSTNRAFVRIGGKAYYLGKYGTEASRREYDRIIGEFIANGRQTLYAQNELLIESLIARFLDHIEKERNYSRDKAKQIPNILKELNRLYGKLPVSQFTPTALKNIRRQYLERKLSRTTINGYIGYIGYIKQVFYWGAEEEMIPANIAGALRTVKELPKGRSAAIEHEEVKPVEDAVIDKTLQHIDSEQIRDMILVQRLISGRPQDIHNMRVCDVDRSRKIWKYCPYQHKTQKIGKTRELPIGPKAQQILEKYFKDKDANSEDFVFDRAGVKDPHRRYAGAIIAGCRKAGVPEWSPNQLRHTGGTAVRGQFGLEGAQVILGHANAATTQIYAKVSYEKAEAIAEKIE